MTEEMRAKTRDARKRCMTDADADIHCVLSLSQLDSRAPTPSLRGFYNLGAILVGFAVIDSHLLLK